jgi:hypothetical protein
MRFNKNLEANQVEKFICNAIGLLLILATLVCLILCFCLQSVGSYIFLAIFLALGHLYCEKAPEFL